MKNFTWIVIISILFLSVFQDQPLLAIEQHTLAPQHSELHITQSPYQKGVWERLKNIVSLNRFRPRTLRHLLLVTGCVATFLALSSCSRTGLYYDPNEDAGQPEPGIECNYEDSSSQDGHLFTCPGENVVKTFVLDEGEGNATAYAASVTENRVKILEVDIASGNTIPRVLDTFAEFPIPSANIRYLTAVKIGNNNYIAFSVTSSENEEENATYLGRTDGEWIRLPYAPYLFFHDITNNGTSDLLLGGVPGERSIMTIFEGNIDENGEYSVNPYERPSIPREEVIPEQVVEDFGSYQSVSFKKEMEGNANIYTINFVYDSGTSIDYELYYDSEHQVVRLQRNELLLEGAEVYWFINHIIRDMENVEEHAQLNSLTTLLNHTQSILSDLDSINNQVQYEIDIPLIECPESYGSHLFQAGHYQRNIIVEFRLTTASSDLGSLLTYDPLLNNLRILRFSSGIGVPLMYNHDLNQDAEGALDFLIEKAQTYLANFGGSHEDLERILNILNQIKSNINSDISFRGFTTIQDGTQTKLVAVTQSQFDGTKTNISIFDSPEFPSLISLDGNYWGLTSSPATADFDNNEFGDIVLGNTLDFQTKRIVVITRGENNSFQEIEVASSDDPTSQGISNVYTGSFQGVSPAIYAVTRTGNILVYEYDDGNFIRQDINTLGSQIIYPSLISLNDIKTIIAGTVDPISSGGTIIETFPMLIFFPGSTPLDLTFNNNRDFRKSS